MRDKERKRTAFDNRTGETFIDVEIGAERECKVIEVQKMMSHLGLESCEDLLFYFDKIDSENDRLFNEINILVDQVFIVVFSVGKYKSILIALSSRS